MSAVLSRIECDEFDVKLIGVTPDTPADLEPGDSDAIVCLDLEAFGLEGVVRWIKDARERSDDPDEPGVVAPTFVVIGKTSHLPLEYTSGLQHELRAAGASYYEWPENCPTFLDAIRHFGAKVNRIYRMFARDEEGFRPAASEAVTGDCSSAGEPGGPDLSVYADPPVRLSDEDFRQLIQRMDSDPSNPED